MSQNHENSCNDQSQNDRPKINLHINISNEPLKKNRVSPQLAKQISSLPVELLQQLQKHEYDVFSWMSKDPQNPYLFFTDPLKALKLAVPALDEKIITKIQEIRQNQRAHEVAQPNIDLNVLTVKAKTI